MAKLGILKATLCWSFRIIHFIIDISGAALGRVPWVPVNPWISRTIIKEPVDFRPITKEPGINTS